MISVPMYHEGSRQLQDRYETRRLADRLVEVVVHDAFTDADRAFIESRPLFFLATADADGRPDCSYKGGRPGFVRVVDPHTLAFPSYDGNGMFKSLGNVLVNPHVGLLFVDFESPRRLRVNGRATVQDNDPLLAEFVGAQLIVRVRRSTRSSRTVRGTSTRCRSSRNHRTRRARGIRRQCPSGRRGRSSARYCRRAIRLRLPNQHDGGGPTDAPGAVDQVLRAVSSVRSGLKAEADLLAEAAHGVEDLVVGEGSRRSSGKEHGGRRRRGGQRSARPLASRFRRALSDRAHTVPHLRRRRWGRSRR